MGLPDAAFWELTLRHFLLLYDVHQSRERRMDRRFGEIAAIVANVNRSEGAEPFTWDDFFPRGNEEEEQDEEGLAESFRLWKSAISTAL